ncbi:hypothetical protein TNCV_3413841 [Trichonephila clavipes]|uniref:Uncharacterized protein n=1 Tax=Trichonephila clavipes TaxID=2585209 RepID=A0A8X6V3S7_TRICX|nr:hypothetical protein TNCV_3413841 [Trichonephila clavipes]
MACLVTSSSPVPQKIRRVGKRCTLNLSRAESSSRGWEQMKPAKCLHQHDFEGLRSLFSDTLASDRLTGVNSSDSSSSLSVLLWSKATISASDRAPYTAMSVSTNT